MQYIKKVSMALAVLVLCLPSLTRAQAVDDQAFHTMIYGYIESYFEKVADQPAGVDADGDTEYESNAHEFDVPSVHLMVQSSIYDDFHSYLNLAAYGASEDESANLEVANAWVEMAVAGEYLVLRGGKTYRRFGLYNEILDATPTYIGIEPPELFDNDHLMLSRTTNLMAYGRMGGNGVLMNYALMTGNDERANDQWPIGADLNFDFNSTVKIGSSFYTTNGKAAPDHGVGDGPSDSGIQPWMAYDRYSVVGGYLQLSPGNLLFQAAYWQAYHRAQRDPDQVIMLVGQGLYDHQLERMGLDGPAPTTADVITHVNYLVETYYVRLGYTFDPGGDARWTFTPYGQYDYFKNPELIQNKNLGGDNEAGLADDGSFQKVTAGVVIRPVWPVAIKLDASAHIQDFNGKQEIYPEGRISVSYFWTL